MWEKAEEKKSERPTWIRSAGSCKPRKRRDLILNAIGSRWGVLWGAAVRRGRTGLASTLKRLL